MRASLLLALALALLPVAGGCAPEAVSVELNFPTEAAFLHATQGRIRVFAVQDDDLGACPELLEGVSTSGFGELEPAYDSALQPSCTFLAGLALPELVGPHAYVVEMRAANDLILVGCRVAEVYAGAETIRVELHPTDGYATYIDEPITGTPASACGGAR
jgi:hypothetical protein